MASIGFPGSLHGPGHVGGHAVPSGRPHARPASGRWVKPLATATTRRPTQQQGHALEVLGRAVEYLVDSYVMNGASNPARAVETELEAVQILMRLNREVFAGCAEVVPVRQRLLRWAATWKRVA